MKFTQNLYIVTLYFVIFISTSVLIILKNNRKGIENWDEDKKDHHLLMCTVEMGCAVQTIIFTNNFSSNFINNPLQLYLAALQNIVMFFLLQLI